MYESAEEVALRERVLLKVKRVLDEFSLHEGLSLMSEQEAAAKQLQLRTFGSFRLGVHSPEADIDACVSRGLKRRRWRLPVYYKVDAGGLCMRLSRLCIAPKHCSRVSFFQKVPILLEATAAVTELHVISDA